MSTSTAVVVLAAGSGRRVGADQNKVLLPLDGRPVLAWSVLTASRMEHVARIVVVVRPEDRDEVSTALAPLIGDRELWLVDGGAERHDSESRAIQALRPDIESGAVTVVALHDAARPLASQALFEAVVTEARTHGSAVPALRVPDLVRADGTTAGADLVAVQTPQAFKASTLVEAYDAAARDGFAGTDTAASWERFTGTGVRAVPGEPRNIKVTFPEDLALASELLRPSNG